MLWHFKLSNMKPKGRAWLQGNGFWFECLNLNPCCTEYCAGTLLPWKHWCAILQSVSPWIKHTAKIMFSPMNGPFQQIKFTNALNRNQNIYWISLIKNEDSYCLCGNTCILTDGAPCVCNASAIVDRMSHSHKLLAWYLSLLTGAMLENTLNS